MIRHTVARITRQCRQCRLPAPVPAPRHNPFRVPVRRLAMASAVKGASPAEVAELQRSGYAYLDVRTHEEFAAGHPPGAVNVPFMFRNAAGMSLNPDFVKQVRELFPDNTVDLVVGCKSGARSAKASALLAQEEYTNLVDQVKGFDGWSAEGLPVET